MTDDHVALEAFCRDAFPKLVGALALYCGDVHVAEELAQEALLRACRRWSHVSKLESPGGWAYRVGANLASNRFRRLRVERRVRQRLGRERSSAKVSAEHVTDNIAVREALAALTDAQREAVILRFYYGMDSPEAAEVLGKSPEAARALLHRATKAMREELGPSTPRKEEAADV